MTSNILPSDICKCIPFDLYVHADLEDYKKELDLCEHKNESTNNYVTCTTFASIAVSKQKQSESSLQPYIKINNEVKQFLSGFTLGILNSAKELHLLGSEFIMSIENTRLTDAEESYIKNTSRGDKEFMEERIYRLKVARMTKFAKIAGEQVTDSICAFVHKLITTTEISRTSVLANAKMKLDDSDLKEDLELKLTAKLKTAMDNSVYSNNDIYRATIIDLIFYFMKCVALVVNRFIWHKHSAQNPGVQTIAGILASHGLGAQFIKEYSIIQPVAQKKATPKAKN